MRKKLLTTGIILSVIVALCLGLSMPATATEERFEVGYARVDINPYIDPSLTGEELVAQTNIMKLPLRGSGDVWNRLSNKGLIDDNGDGVIDSNDGLKVTCVAVTDESGKTVLMITIDLIGGYILDTSKNNVSDVILARVNEAVAAGEIDNVSLSLDQIFFAGTHTHNAPDRSAYTAAGKTGTNNYGEDLALANNDLGIWIDRTVNNVADAAIAALKDRSPATVTKDQISASEATSDAVVGKTLVGTRHYINSSDGSIAGDNFNDRGSDPKQVTKADDTIYLLTFDFAEHNTANDASKLPIVLAGWRGHPSLNNTNSFKNSGANVISSDYVNAFRHALEYGVDVQCSTTDNYGQVENWTLGTTQKYRVAFFQGNGGNTNPRSYEVMKDADGNSLTYGSGTTVRGCTWIDESAKATGNSRGCCFGVVLATMANEGLTDGKYATPVTAGAIRTAKNTFTSPRKLDGVTSVTFKAANAYKEAVTLQSAANQTYTDANDAYNAYVTAYTAWEAAQKDYDDAGLFGFLYQDKLDEAVKARDAAKTTYDSAMASHNEKLTTYETFMTANSNNDFIIEKTATVNYAVPPNEPMLSLPFTYKDATGEIFVIGSSFHANAIIDDWNVKLDVARTAASNITVRAFMLGDELAFVSVPGEPFDYYFKEPGIYTAQNNMWNDLIGDTYGKPFVLGYCNGSFGYIPNYQSYDYNRGSTTKATGSYEVHTSDYSQGTGEEMIQRLGYMLDGLSAKSRTVTCQHCKKDVLWQPFLGEKYLASGHYYLAGDIECEQVQITKDAKVCLDLNGYTLTGTSRALYLQPGATVLSLMDTSDGQSGVVQGCGGSVGIGFGGAVMNVASGTTFNFYSGNLKRDDKDGIGTYMGGIVLTYGTFNMYGGTVHGGIASAFTGDYVDNNGDKQTRNRNAVGGTIYVSAGSLNMFGGQILTGSFNKVIGTVIGDEEKGYAYSQTTEPSTGLGPCVAVAKAGTLKLSGNVRVDDIYFEGGLAAKLTVEGAYTGTAKFSYPSGTAVTKGTDIGDVVADADGNRADVSGANITIENAAGLTAAVRENDLIVSDSPLTTDYCEVCDNYFYWKPMTDAEFDKSTYTKKLPAGHYVLTEDVDTTQKQLNGDGTNPGTFCIDLAGHTYNSTFRAFYTVDAVVLNIMDSVGTGVVSGESGSNSGGGVLYAQGTSVINLYSGTVRHKYANTNTILNGGGVRVNGGTFNMYGGSVVGMNVSDCGGAIYVFDEGKCKILGGQVLAGSAAKYGDCIYIADKGTVTVGQTAHVDDIFYAVSSASTFTLDTAAEEFTGYAQLTFKTQPAVGADIGNYVAGNGMKEGAVVLADSAYCVKIDGTDLVFCEPAAKLIANGEETVKYATLSSAVADYTYHSDSRSHIKLLANIADAVTVLKDTYVDLNGYSITGDVIVDSGAALYCMDSQTDDYTVQDGKYGMLKGTVTGTVAGVPVNTVSAVEGQNDPHRAGYMMVSEDGNISFHRVNLKIKSMALRPKCVGVYYKGNFRGDEVVAGKVETFGISLSLKDVPSEEIIDRYCMSSVFTGFVSGKYGNLSASTGTLLQNIMRTTNTDATNNENASLDVYGCAYIRTKDGYFFGAPVIRDLNEQVVAIDGIWNSLSEVQKGKLLDMYGTYKTVMQEWDIPMIMEAYNQKTAQ